MRRPVTFPVDVVSHSEDTPPSLHLRPHRRHAAAAVAGIAVVLALATACTPPSPAATATSPGRTTATASAAPTPTPTPPPVLVPEGTAADNLPYFRSVVEQVWASADNARGSAYTDALSAAGFDRATMQLTSDTTTIGQPAESIQFSVAWRDACLVGQVGPATGDPVVAVLPLLSSGGCLIGGTAPLDG